MSLLSVLFYLFISVGLFHLIHFALYTVGANVYDIKKFRKDKKKSQNEVIFHPKVSVLIPAYNEEKVVERCLRSVWNSSYEKIDIVVINDGSKDKTINSVQRFIKRHQKRNKKSKATPSRNKNYLKRSWKIGRKNMVRTITLVSQPNRGKARALNNGLRRRHNGELIMTLDADSILHKHAITNSVKYFKDPDIVGVAANVRVIEEMSVLGLLQRFEHMVGYRAKKLYTITNSELIIGGVGSMYRLKTLNQVGHYDTDTVTEDIGLSMKIAAKGNKKNKLVYGADVAAMTEGVGDFRSLLTQRYRWKLGNLQNLFKYKHMMFSRDKKYTKSLTWYRVPMGFFGEVLLLLEPIILGYVIYISAKFLSPALFISAYMAITVYILFVIWPDEHLTFKGKLKASAVTPVLYFIFYIMNFIQLFSIVKCLFNRNDVLNLKQRKNTWVSPKRAGRAANFS